MSYDALPDETVTEAGATRIVDQAGNVLQDPVYDHANGQEVTAIGQAVKPAGAALPAGCKYVQLDAAGATVRARTDGTAIANGTAGELAKCIRLYAGVPVIVGVQGAPILSFYCESGTGSVLITPMKARS